MSAPVPVLFTGRPLTGRHERVGIVKERHRQRGLLSQNSEFDYLTRALPPVTFSRLYLGQHSPGNTPVDRGGHLRVNPSAIFCLVLSLMPQINRLFVTVAETKLNEDHYAQPKLNALKRKQRVGFKLHHCFLSKKNLTVQGLVVSIYLNMQRVQ